MADPSLKQLVAEASRRVEVRDAITALYADVQHQIDMRRPLCVASGRCCRFEEFGHRLFVTTMELAAFVHHLDRGRADEATSRKTAPLPITEERRDRVPLPQADGATSANRAGFAATAERVRIPIHPAGWDGSGCPFQVNKLCGVHAIRPFGCRMFFCDATSTLWQNETYERFHANLKRLHEELAVPYRYIEWRAGLRELGLAPMDDPIVPASSAEERLPGG